MNPYRLLLMREMDIKMNYKERYDAYKAAIDSRLGEKLRDENALHSWLLEAMRYSLMGGGKRVRPVLVMEFARISGSDPDKALGAACAVEMMHTYSLIHDDLPCMDDDDMRRGQPTCHIEYGEAAAVLAGDALQAQAFMEILGSRLADDVKVSCAMELSRAAGESGMCGGQILDIDGGSDKNENELMLIHSMKTSALLEAACVMGAMCGGASQQQLESAREYARNLGLAFQIRDDMLDVIGRSQELGKTAGADGRENRATFMTLYGEEKCGERVREFTEKAKLALQGGFEDTGFLSDLADSLSVRNA